MPCPETYIDRMKTIASTPPPEPEDDGQQGEQQWGVQSRIRSLHQQAFEDQVPFILEFVDELDLTVLSKTAEFAKAQSSNDEPPGLQPGEFIAFLLELLKIDGRQIVKNPFPRWLIAPDSMAEYDYLMECGRRFMASGGTLELPGEQAVAPKKEVA